MCTICQSFNGCDFDPYAGGTAEAYSGTASSQPVYTYDQIADYLTEGFWSDFGTTARHFDTLMSPISKNPISGSGTW